MEEYKSLNKLRNKQKTKQTSKVRNYIKSFIMKSMICITLFIVMLIVIKAHPSFKSIIYKNVYEDNFSFAKINNLYQKYFGDILPFDNIVPNDDELVFQETLKYKDISLYKDGAKLTVTTNYLVPAIESGIIVYVGEKEGYGNTIIVQQINGIDVWYGNVNISDLKLYDYIEKGNMLGETNGDTMYMIFQKEGTFLDYKEYI